MAPRLTVNKQKKKNPKYLLDSLDVLKFFPTLRQFYRQVKISELQLIAHKSQLTTSLPEQDVGKLR